jgi:hypothetical protein
MDGRIKSGHDGLADSIFSRRRGLAPRRPVERSPESLALLIMQGIDHTA